MSLLAIDTSTLVSSVALATKHKLIAELTVHTRKTHSERLMPHIAEILCMSDMEKNELQAIAVSIGPGSFTGLRIGLATAKSLAYALNIPIIGVPTLASLAYACPVPGVVIVPMLDAQKGNTYQAEYCWQDGNLIELKPPHVAQAVQSLTELASRPEPVLLVGESAVQYQEQVKELSGSLILGQPHIVIPRAGNVALMAHQLLEQGISQDVMTLEPMYIRRSEAEVLWERRQGMCV